MNKDKEKNYSEEQLNAFVDGELDSVERNQLLNESIQSSELDQRLCERRKMKEFVHLAYEDLPSPYKAKGNTKAGFSLLTRSFAASILIIIGIIAGVIIQQQYQSANSPLASVIAPSETQNHILHVVNGEEADMRAVLRQARILLDHTDGEVEIIANEKGLNLLRSDVTPFAKEINALAEDNVAFYACARAIQRLEEKGVTVELVAAANSHYTALDRLVLRLQDKWNYTKI